MTSPYRCTIVAHGRLAMRELRLKAARERRHGLQVMTFEQLAARLAGGFSAPLDDESLREAVQAVLPTTALEALDPIKHLPGMAGAATETLRKVWRAGIDLQSMVGQHARIRSLAQLETTVLERLPRTMRRPGDLVIAAMDRLEHAESVLGPVDIVGITELSPCWRPLLKALAERTPVKWIAGPRAVPAWLEGSAVTVVRDGRLEPEIVVVGAATAYHESIEAMRWARSLIASGKAKPEEIAIASTMTAEYDDHIMALSSDAGLDVHFAHGVRVAASRPGQAAAALADILLRGLSQSRFRRLAALLAKDTGPFKVLPSGWTKILPADAPLTTVEAWNRLLDRVKVPDWPDSNDHSPELKAILQLLENGVEAASEIGDALLRGRALAIWRKALLAGPPAALDGTLEALKQDDGLDPCVSVAWMPASALAASPRRYVRLMGLNSMRWPRGIAEDRLLPDHIVPASALDPLPVGAADRRDFETIMVTTGGQVTLSRSRRDSEGRMLGKSSLLHGQPSESYLRRHATPAHAMSETDRLLARPAEFALLEQAASANRCWRNWRSQEITSNDGLLRPDHPLVEFILGRSQSASSLRRLLRSPLGYVWRYGLRLREPQSGSEPLVLDPLEFGSLVHETLDRGLRRLEAAGGLASANGERIAAALAESVRETAAEWESVRAVPPGVIWRRTLDEARTMAELAFAKGQGHGSDMRSYSEVPFGGSEPKASGDLPWDRTVLVQIPGAGFRINGYIDRLDMTSDGGRISVTDYKTGKPPNKPIVLDQGKELQRCLYAFAVRALLGSDAKIIASLLYLRDGTEMQLEDPETSLATLGRHLQAARTGLLAGSGVMGPDTGSRFDELKFALPANAPVSYCKRKMPAVKTLLGDATLIWEAE